jgi:hypothetical protein
MSSPAVISSQQSQLTFNSNVISSVAIDNLDATLNEIYSFNLGYSSANNVTPSTNVWNNLVSNFGFATYSNIPVTFGTVLVVSGLQSASLQTNTFSQITGHSILIFFDSTSSVSISGGNNISANTALSLGISATVFFNHVVSASIDNTLTLTFNSAAIAGGIYSEYSVISFGTTTIASNSALGSGSLIVGNGGNVYLNGGNLLMPSTVTGTLTSNNGNAAGSGGGLYAGYTASILLTQSTADQTGLFSSVGPNVNLAASFTSNAASTEGGAIWAQSNLFQINAGVFEYNTAGQAGGAIYLLNSSALGTQSNIDEPPAAITANFTNNTVGGFYVTPSDLRDGGAIASTRDLNIQGGTFSDNTITNCAASSSIDPFGGQGASILTTAQLTLTNVNVFTDVYGSSCPAVAVYTTDFANINQCTFGSNTPNVVGSSVVIGTSGNTLPSSTVYQSTFTYSSLSVYHNITIDSNPGPLTSSFNCGSNVTACLPQQ